MDLLTKHEQVAAKIKVINNTKVKRFNEQPPEVQERFRRYASTKQDFHLARLIAYEEGCLDLCLKFYPELDSIDWENADPQWVEDTWLYPVAGVRQKAWLYPLHAYDWGQPYAEVCKLPRKEFAKRILRAMDEDITVTTCFDREQMLIWAGIAKPTKTQDGNIVTLDFGKPK